MLKRRRWKWLIIFYLSYAGHTYEFEFSEYRTYLLQLLSSYLTLGAWFAIIDVNSFFFLFTCPYHLLSAIEINIFNSTVSTRQTQSKHSVEPLMWLNKKSNYQRIGLRPVHFNLFNLLSLYDKQGHQKCP